MIKHFLFLLLPFFIQTGSRCQPVAMAHVQQYTTENGLPSNGIKGLQWDEKTGFLWIATEAGIVRFNGVDFRSFTNENMPSIGSERILFMTRNHRGGIYISDMVGNIFKIVESVPVLWINTPVNTNPYYDSYHLLNVSDSFFRKYGGVIKSATFSAVTDKIISLSETSCLIFNSGSLFYQDISLPHPKPLPFPQKSFIAAFKIGNRCFIVNTKKEVLLLDPLHLTLTPVTVTDGYINLLKNEINNTRIFWEPGMQSPVFIHKEKAWVFTYDGGKINATLLFDQVPADAFIKSVQYSEKNKVLFIGTDSKGLIVINQNRVVSKKRVNINSKNRNSYYAQLELPDGNILTNEGDIIGNNPVAAQPLPLKGKFGYSISVTNDSLVWYYQPNSTFGFSCLHQYNKRTRQTIAFKDIRAESIVTSNGRDTWLANIAGILKYEADSFRYLYKHPNRVTGNQVFDIKEIQPGVLMLATCAGILRFTINSAVLDTVLSKPAGCVRNIRQYKEYVFVGTYGAGFYMYKKGVLKKMPLDKNRFLLYTHCIVPDNYGYCWISTNRGLFKARLDEMINAFDNNGTAIYYHFFGKKDGMEMTELNGGCSPCALQMKNNIISFPTMDGLLWVDPETANPVLPEGGIFIDEVILDDKVTDYSLFTQRSLPAKTGEIIIRLAFSAWCNKENIYLEYQLNDTLSWKAVNAGNDAEIRFNNLPPGNYTLRMRKLNGFGSNNYTYRQISFSITTPWHQRWWFYLVCGLLLFGLVALYLRFRTRQYKIRQRKLEQQVDEKTKELQQQNEVLEKNNTIKTRLISIISHDIVTPLKFLTVAGKNLLEKRELMSAALQQETIQEMANTSQELQFLSTNILNWIKYQNENRRLSKENFNVYELVNQVLGILTSVAKQKKLQLRNEVDPAMEIRQYFEPLKILVYNLLTNAIHFSEKGVIVIAAAPEEMATVISVTDEGVGMTAEQIQNIMADQFIISSANIDNRKGNGLGYLIIKDLLKTMGATIHISSEKGKGTVVKVRVPLGALK